MSFIEQLGEQIGQGVESAAAGLPGAAVNMGMGILGNIFGQQQQFKQAQKMQGLQIQGQEQLMDYSMQKQMDMWNATNYPAQMQQLTKAGLNPGLIYAKGGPGGITGSPQGGATGQQAQMQNPAMGIQINPMMASQVELMKAQANQANAQADATRGYQKDLAQSVTGLNIANTGNLQQDTELKKIETDVLDINKQLQGATLNTQIQTIETGLQKSMQELGIMQQQFHWNAETMETRIRKVTAEYIGQLLTNNLTAALTGQAKAQTRELNARTTLDFATAKAEIGTVLNQFDSIWGSNKDGKTVQEHWNDIQKNYTEKLINLGVGAEVIHGVGTILDHIPALNMVPGRIPFGTKPSAGVGFKINSNY